MKFSPLVLLGGLTLALAADAASSTSCPPAGQTNAAGDYSCNPAHEYPSGQACALIGDCYFLRGMGAILPTSTSSGPQPTQSCPAAGETNAAGEYSCNPAHQYPNGQVCALIGGCYFLRGTGGEISSMGSVASSTVGWTHTTVAPAQSSVVVVAGAGRMHVAGGLIAAAAGVLLV